MKYIKLAIIICAILAIIVIIAILSMLPKDEQYITNSSVDNAVNEISGQNQNTVQEQGTNLYKVTNRDNFYTVASCINKYLGYLVSGNSENVYNTLDIKYRLENNITKNNVFEKVWKPEMMQIFEAEEMKYATKGNITNYFVRGTVRDDIMDEIADQNKFYIKVNIDSKFKIFSIEEISKEQFVEEQITQSKLVDSIVKENCNTFEQKIVSDKEMARTYLIKYKNMLLNNVEEAYSLLDKEYANSMFTTLEDFQRYVNENYNSILEISLNKYSVISGKYTCIDKNDNYYIFKENGVMNFSVLLDEYTVLNALEYSKKTNEEKAEYNVQRFINFINFKNYDGAYNLLNEQFRNNNFATIEQFREYFENNFFARNKIDNITVETIDDLYTVSVDITDLDYNSDNKVSKTFIIKLQDKTCELSFNK